MTCTNCPSSIEAPSTAMAEAAAPLDGVGDVLQPDLHERHEAWLREQYMRDQDVIERWELAIEEEAGRCDG